MEKDKTSESLNVKFTNRQLEVINCWSKVANEKAIGEMLGISDNSVHTHLRRMRIKLGVKKTFHVYQYAKNNNLI